MSLDLTDEFDYDENAVLGTATKNTSTSVDLKIDKADIYVKGGKIIFKNATWGDYITAQVIDKDNVLGYGPNTVLNEYIHKRYLHPDLKQDNLEVSYAGLVPKDTYLRLIYTSVSTTTDANVAINYYLHHRK